MANYMWCFKASLVLLILQSSGVRAKGSNGDGWVEKSPDDEKGAVARVPRTPPPLPTDPRLLAGLRSFMEQVQAKRPAAWERAKSYLRLPESFHMPQVVTNHVPQAVTNLWNKYGWGRKPEPPPSGGELEYQGSLGKNWGREMAIVQRQRIRHTPLVVGDQEWPRPHTWFEQIPQERIEPPSQDQDEPEPEFYEDADDDGENYDDGEEDDETDIPIQTVQPYVPEVPVRQQSQPVLDPSPEPVYQEPRPLTQKVSAPQPVSAPLPAAYEEPSQANDQLPQAYEAPQMANEPPPQTYEAPQPVYDPPPPASEAPQSAYAPSPPAYEAPQPVYAPPPPAYEAPQPVYAPPPPAYEPPSPVINSRLNFDSWHASPPPAPANDFGSWQTPPSPAYHSPPTYSSYDSSFYSSGSRAEEVKRAQDYYDYLQAILNEPE